VGIEFREVRKGDRAVLLHVLRKLAENEKDVSNRSTVQAAAAALSQ